MFFQAYKMSLTLKVNCRGHQILTEKESSTGQESEDVVAESLVLVVVVEDEDILLLGLHKVFFVLVVGETLPPGCRRICLLFSLQACWRFAAGIFQ